MDIKRIVLSAVTALAALALVAPAAKADVYLSDSGGTLEPGAELTATSTNLRQTFGGSGNVTLHCGLATIHFELIDAGTEHLELVQIGVGTTENCTYQDPEKSFPQTVTDNTLGVGNEGILTIDTWGTANTTATFISELFADAGHTIKISECHFEGNLHLVATGETGDTLEVTPSTMVGTPLGSCGHLTTHGTFTLETANGDPVSIHYTETA